MKMKEGKNREEKKRRERAERQKELKEWKVKMREKEIEGKKKIDPENCFFMRLTGPERRGLVKWIVGQGN